MWSILCIIIGCISYANCYPGKRYQIYQDVILPRYHTLEFDENEITLQRDFKNSLIDKNRRRMQKKEMHHQQYLKEIMNYYLNHIRSTLTYSSNTVQFKKRPSYINNKLGHIIARPGKRDSKFFYY